MKALLEQLAMLYGAAAAIEAKASELASECGPYQISDARDYLVSITLCLQGIELKLARKQMGIPDPDQIIDCAVGLSPLMEGIQS